MSSPSCFPSTPVSPEAEGGWSNVLRDAGLLFFPPAKSASDRPNMVFCSVTLSETMADMLQGVKRTFMSVIDRLLNILVKDQNGLSNILAFK